MLGSQGFRAQSENKALLKGNQPLSSAATQALPFFLNFWLEVNSTLHTAKLATGKAVRAIVFFLFSTLISSETEHHSNYACQL